MGGLALLAAFACTPKATTTQPQPSEVTSEAPSDFGPWQATLNAEHPLVSTVWSASEGRVLTRAELEARVRGAKVVLLGETHDHPDHHRLQGEMIRLLIEREGDTKQRGPAVAYEMLDPAKQGTIETFMRAGTGDPEAFAELVDWANSGWPEWSLYRPAFAPVLEAGLPVIAAQFPRSESKRFMSEGLAVLPAETVARYQLDAPLDPSIESAWLDEMFVSHCEMVPREQLSPMVTIQRIRDAVMADALLRGLELRDQAVLIAGTGHTRDVGVPRLLRMAGIDDAQILSIGFVSVAAEHLEPADYGDEHDLIVLTPGVEREDPCEGMRASMGG